MHAASQDQSLDSCPTFWRCREGGHKVFPETGLGLAAPTRSSPSVERPEEGGRLEEDHGISESSGEHGRMSGLYTDNAGFAFQLHAGGTGQGTQSLP